MINTEDYNQMLNGMAKKDKAEFYRRRALHYRELLKKGELYEPKF